MLEAVRVGWRRGRTSNLGGSETGACSCIQQILTEPSYGPALHGGSTVVNESATVTLHRTTASEGETPFDRLSVMQGKV